MFCHFDHLSWPDFLKYDCSLIWIQINSFATILKPKFSSSLIIDKLVELGFVLSDFAHFSFPDFLVSMNFQIISGSLGYTYLHEIFCKKNMQE